MSIYIRRSDGGVASYDGMTLDQIETMLTEQGLTFDVITEEDFTAAMPKPKQTS